MKAKNIGTIWFTGLSASGKTTLSKRLFDDLQELSVNNIVLLDGEAIRDQLNNHSFDLNNREQIGVQKAKIALDLNKKGKIVLISGIAHKKKWRNDIRDMFDNYIEVYLKCSATHCAERDYKGNYANAISGKIDNFIGISEPYEESDNADLILDTEKNSIDVCANLLLEKVRGDFGI
jgi:adenylylsulfate kinase-like enzyme